MAPDTINAPSDPKPRIDKEVLKKTNYMNQDLDSIMNTEDSLYYTLEKYIYALVGFEDGLNTLIQELGAHKIRLKRKALNIRQRHRIKLSGEQMRELDKIRSLYSKTNFKLTMKKLMKDAAKAP